MRRELLVGFLLVAAVLLLYWPVHSYPFVLLDDQSYVSENPIVGKGFTSEGFAYAFTRVTVGNWHPLTILSHMLDCQLYGIENAGGHHMTNVLFHAANTLLLFIALLRMTGAVWRSGFVAGLFGLHPLHVESVAWISERKDVLSTFFFLLMLLAYHHYAQRRTLPRYALVLLLLLFGLMSKPMLVTAPLVLLLLDFWPLARLRLPPAIESEMPEEEEETEPDESGESEHHEEAEEHERAERTHEEPALDESKEANAARTQEETSADEREWDEPPAEEEYVNEVAASSGESSLRSLIAEKIPLFVLVAMSAVITLIVQRSSGAMGMLGQSLPLAARLGNAICSCGVYVEKMFWPQPLSVIYPFTTPHLIDVVIIGASLAAVTYAAYRLARVKPYLTLGWWWYLITLLPVIGIVQVGIQRMADRYTYIPSIGLFIIAAWGAAEMAEGMSARGRMGVAAGAIALLAVFAGFTRQQLTTWSSSEALFQHAVDAEPNNYLALHGLGMYYWKEGRLDDARSRFEAIIAIESDPKMHVAGGFEPAHRALGTLFAAQHKPQQALQELDRAIEIQPRLPEARRHKAWLLATYTNDKYRNGKEAERLAREALDLSQTKAAEFWDTLAAAQAENRNFKAAVESEEKAIEAAKRTHALDLLEGLEYRLDKFQHREVYHAEPGRPLRM